MAAAVTEHILKNLKQNKTKKNLVGMSNVSKLGF